MGIRETMNENRSVTIGATIGITVLAVLWITWYSITGGEMHSVPDATPRARHRNPPN